MSRQAGFSVLTLLLLVVVILGGLVFVVIGSGPNVAGQMNAQKTAQLVAQAQLIVHRIVKCATDYPTGNNGTASHKAYPLDANPGARGIETLTCPGNSQNLWSGVDGVYPPVQPGGFDGWTYTKTTPVTIAITSSQAATYSPSIAAAAARIGLAASATADTLTVKVIE
jgi:type II secretory pathway pseudopilin PulG